MGWFDNGTDAPFLFPLRVSRVAGFLFLILLLFQVHAAFAADVQVSQFLDNPDPAVRGDELTYSIRVENGDPDTASAVELNLPLPNTVEFVSVNDATCHHDGLTPGTVTCTFGDLDGPDIGGPVMNIEVVVRTTDTTPGFINATATGSTASTDLSPGNDALTEGTTINDGADLSVSVSDSPDPVVAGADVTYALTVSNAGPNDADTLTLTTILPTNVTYTSASGSGWSCANSGQTVTCTRANVADGAASPAANISATVTSAVVGTLTLSTSVTATTGDPDLNNNTTTEDTAIDPGADLSITKTVLGAAIGATEVTFRLSPRNAGPFDANTVEVTDTLPAGFTYTGASGSGWTCGASGQTVTCTRGTYAVGASDNIDITATAPVSGTGIDNTASITAATADPDSGNNSDTETFDLVPDGADLSITKTKSPDPVAQGAEITSRIRVTNNGPKATTGTLTVTDTLAAGETYDRFSGSGWSCTSSGNEVTCLYSGTLADGASTSYLDIISVATDAGTLANTACASDAGGETDRVADNHCSSRSVTSTALMADLLVTKSADAGGDTTLAATETIIVYTIDVTNQVDGDGTGVSGIVLNDNIPGYVSGSTSVSVTGKPANYTCTTGSNVRCTQESGSLAEGASDSFEITVERPLYDGNRTNTASAYSDDLGDPDRTDNSALATVTVEPVADLEMQSLTVNPDPTTAGTEATFVATFINNGPSTANGVVVSIDLSAGSNAYTYISATPSEGACSFDTPSETLTCNGIDLARTDSETVTLRVRPRWQSGEVYTDIVATATITATTHDNDAANDSKTRNLGVTTSDLDMLVNQTDLTDPIGYDNRSGQEANNIITYQVIVTNQGPSLATGVEFSSVMAPKAGKTLEFLGDKPIAGGSDYSAAYCYDYVGDTVTGPADLTLTCNLPDMADGASVTRYLDFEVTTAPDSSGDIHTNTVAVRVNETDSVSSNDSGSETTTVRKRVDLAVSKTVSADPVQLYEPFEWTITVNNLGPGDSDNTDVTDTLPGGMEFYGAGPSWSNTSGGSGTCTTTGLDLSCDLGLLASSATATITVPVRITAYPGTTTTNCAAATTDQVDPDLTNNDNECQAVTVQRSRIDAYVYRDLDDDGAMDVGEGGISGVALRLTGTDNFGNTVNHTTTTDSDGRGRFDNLTQSDGSGYTLTQTHPVGFFDGQESDDNGATIIGGSKTTDLISGIVLAANTNLGGYLFGELPPAGVSGYVWHDADNDGVRDGGETIGANAVTLTLTGTDDLGAAVNTTATTNASGAYSFTGLRPGTYTLTETQPAGWLPGRATAGSGTSVAGTPDNAPASADYGNLIAGLALTPGQTGSGFNFGELQAASLAGFVFNDRDADGAQDAGEPGVSGNTIDLDGTDDLGNAVSQSTTSGADGSYSFSGLRPGTYTLTETQPGSYADGDDTAGSLGGSVADDVISAIGVASGQNGTGYLFAERRGSISGSVFADLDDDAARDGGEPAIAGVTLSLTGTDSFGNPVNLTTTTDASGNYSFIDLVASDASGYLLGETQPAAYKDGQESRDGGTTAITASKTTDSIPTIVVAAGAPLSGYLFGELPGTSVSGTIWHDADNDGVQDGGETTRLENVQLALSGTDDRGDSVNLTVTSDAFGAYIFPSLRPGTYTLSETQPAGWLGGLAMAGSGATSAGTADNDAASANFGNRISTIVLSADEAAVDYRFAELQPSFLGGGVFDDVNGNSAPDAGEPTFGGISITLTGTDDLGRGVNRTTTTASDGGYLFSDLRPGTYTLSETQPAGYVDGPEIAGSLGGTVAADAIGDLVIVSGSGGTGYYFTEAGSGLSGSVFLDENNDGLMDAGESGIADVMLTLTGTDADGNSVSLAALTGADGGFTFAALPLSDAAGYTLTETQPTVWADGEDHAGTAGGSAGDDAISGIVLSGTSSASGYTFAERGGRLTGSVYRDLDNDGVKDDAETGLVGVTITLTGTDGTGAIINRTTLTAADGNYAFNHLPAPDAGGYTLTETQPAGELDGQDSLGTLGGALGNDVFSAIGFPQAGAEGSAYRFGERAAGSAQVSGRVWLDRNHDRLDNDAGGAPGWVVELLKRTDPLDNERFMLAATTTTDTAGDYLFSDIMPDEGYEIRFRHPVGHYVFGTPVSELAGVDLSYGTIRDITLTAGDNVIDQSLPLDPTGVVYDAITRHPLADALVTLSGPPGFDPDLHLVGGGANLNQTTDANGLYQYLLLDTAPAGEYGLTVTAPDGYLPEASVMLPPCGGVLSVGPVPDPATVQTSDQPPALGVTQHEAATCAATTTDLVAGADTTQYYLAFDLTPGSSADLVNNHIPLDPILEDALVLTKSVSKAQAAIGDLLTYTIEVDNTTAGRIRPFTLRDMIPAGFKYVGGSARIDGVDQEPTGQRPLLWEDLSIPPEGRLTLTYNLVVGTGVLNDQVYKNRAVAIHGLTGTGISNQAVAAVQVIGDPIFADALVIGKVFHDHNEDGVQQKGETGIAGVRVAATSGTLMTTDNHGRYHLDGIQVKHFSRGRNLILKVDPQTLPRESEFTTENPRVIRITQGLMQKVNFGIRLPERRILLPTKTLPPIVPLPIPAPVDTDGDGVIDGVDRCPQTPAGIAVDGVGCPKPLLEDFSLDLKVEFDTDKAVVKPRYDSRIREVAHILEAYPDVRVVIEGHTDSRGSDAYNLALSKRRAKSVRRYLIEELGADGSRIYANGFGEFRPIADNATAEGRQRNRRIVAVVVPAKTLAATGADSKLEPKSGLWSWLRTLLVSDAHAAPALLPEFLLDAQVERLEHHTAVTLEFSGPVTHAVPVTSGNELQIRLKGVKAKIPSYSVLSDKSTWLLVEPEGGDLIVRLGLPKDVARYELRPISDPPRLVLDIYPHPKKAVATSVAAPSIAPNAAVLPLATPPVTGAVPLPATIAGASGESQAETRKEPPQIMITTDSLSLRRVLNVQLVEPTALPCGHGAAKAVFQAYTSYIDFIDHWVLDVYGPGRTDPFWTREGKAWEFGAPIVWELDDLTCTKLPPGEYVYVLRVFDARGNADTTRPRTFQVQEGVLFDDDASPTATAKKDTSTWEKTSASAAGAVDRDNTAERHIPLAGGRVSVSGVGVPQGASVTVNDRPVPVDNQGRFAEAYLKPNGRYRFEVTVTPPSGERRTYSEPVEIAEKAFFMVGMLDLTAGHRTTSGELEQIDSEDDFEEKYYLDGRAAMYLKGKIKGKYLLTAQVDTGEEPVDKIFERFDDKDPRRVFRQLDPDAYYPVYGDDSETTSDVDTQGKLYVRLEWDKSHLLWGNYQSGLDETTINRFNRSLYGAKAHLESKDATAFGDSQGSATTFGAQPDTLHSLDELRATGGSLYYLKHGDVVVGSEQIRVQVVDALSGRVTSTVLLEPGRDYEMDWLQGRLILTRRVDSIVGGNELISNDTLGGNRAYLVAEYEYVPTTALSGENTYGLRGSHWLGDHLRVGGTYVHEQRPSGSAYENYGADVVVKLKENTELAAEYGITRRQMSNGHYSEDGGLTYIDIPETDSDDESRAWDVRLKADLTDWSEDLPDLNLDSHYGFREKNYSNSGSRILNDTELYGAKLAYGVTENTDASLRYDRQDEEKGSLVQSGTAQLAHRYGPRLKLTGEVRGQQIEDPGEPDLEDLLGALRVDYRLTDFATLYGAQQATLTRNGDTPENNRTTLGTGVDVTRRLHLDLEGSNGNLGEGARLGGRYKVTDSHDIYGGVQHQRERHYGTTTRTTMGNRGQVSERLDAFSEHQVTSGSHENGISDLFGLTYRPDSHWTYSADYSHGAFSRRGQVPSYRYARVADDGTSITTAGFSQGAHDAITRDIVTAAAAFTKAMVNFRTKGQVRWDEGEEDFTQYVTANYFDWDFRFNMSLLLEFNYSLTDYTGSTDDAHFYETSLGYAYRPVLIDRLNLIGKYTFLEEVSPVDQIDGTDPDERAHVFAVEGVYDLTKRWQLGQKLAFKRSEMRADRNQGAWFTSDTYLSVTRLNYHLTHKWDALAEYRMLWNTLAEDEKKGWLVALYRHIGDHTKFGVGYNFTEFNDDLTHLSYDDQGPFVNLVLKW